ncbi:hypothetical protein [Pseudotabrizicola algicola]|uniref:Uncharacterized protein n=1 Tax=Pseudotabrizicola algicola TaxID=2709381 RepID=A0A6B3RIH8_9RHOB|nr:hypothetical protein [Pseudotabrizicola algicola]NEX45221.1 hypothetical protein [Pseudotabrizicola algicola]
MTRAVTLADLRRAAQVAREAGVAVTIEADGKTYRISPDPSPLPLGAAEREISECDKAFGLSG